MIVWHQKKRYTKAFEAALSKQVVGTTITHTTRVKNTPPTTVARVVRSWKTNESARIQEITPKEQTILQRLLSYSPLLTGVYWWKEAFIGWCHCSATYELKKKDSIVGWKKANR